MRRQSVKASHHCALALEGHVLTAACGRVSSGQFVVDTCSELADVDINHISKALSPWIQKHRIKQAICSWVLTGQQYQLFQIDALQVPKEELRNAIAWQVQELLDYPIEEAVFDIFPSVLPLPGNSQQGWYVAVSKLAFIQQLKMQLSKSGLRLKTIDIKELVLRNIVSLFAANQGLVLVNLTRSYSQLIIGHEMDFRFTRQLETVLPRHGEAGQLSAVSHILQTLALEIQRSLDYYTSQLRQPAPDRLVVVCPHHLTDEEQQRLGGLLNIQVHGLDLTSLLTWAQPVSTSLQNKVILPLGSFIRHKVTTDAATS